MANPQHSREFGGFVVRACLRAFARPLSLALGCAMALSATDAPARDDAPRGGGGWAVAASKDGKGCFLTREYARNGGTTLLLGLDTDGTNRLSVLNPNWSIRPRDRLKLDFRLSGSSYPAHFAVGIVSDGKRGFVTSFGAKFPAYFATSATLDISRGDVPVERLGLEGSGAAVAGLEKCVVAQRGKARSGENGDMQADRIPSDPFAPASGKRNAGR